MQFAAEIREGCYQKNAQGPWSHSFVTVLVSYRRKLTANTRATLMNMTTYINPENVEMDGESCMFSIFHDSKHSGHGLKYCDPMWFCKWIPTFWRVAALIFKVETSTHHM
jgi:hypothetical protein